MTNEELRRIDPNYCYRCKKCKRQYYIKGADGEKKFGYLPDGVTLAPKGRYNKLIPFCNPCGLTGYEAK